MSATHLARFSLALVSAVGLRGIVIAADDPPGAQPDATVAIAAHPSPPPIPLNSGVSPQQFESNAKKVTEEVLPNGIHIFHRNGQGMHAVSAHLGADGNITYSCTNRLEQATQSAAVPTNAHEQ